MASRTSNAWDANADGRPPVAADLETIFAPLPRVTPIAAPSTARPATAPRRRLPGGMLFLIAVALIALVGSLAFLMPVAHQPPAPHKPRAATLPAPAPIMAHATPQPVAPTPAKVAAKPVVAPPTHRGACPRFATEAWCLHGTITAADDRLRDAYDAAVRAGVDRDILVDIRSDWQRLRGRANRDPEALIRGYAALTQELRAETDRALR